MENRRSENRRFKALQIEYSAMIDTDRLPENVVGARLPDVMDLVRSLFQSLISRATEGLEPQDLIRFVVMTEYLDRPISTVLTRVSDFTVETILSCVQKVLQSKDQIALDEGFTVNVIVVKRPLGAGRNVKVINPEVDGLKKKSIINIKKDDLGVCCAMAIILGKAILTKDPEVRTLQDRRSNVLTRKALALHASTGVPEGPCGFEEITTFERHMDVQVIVISCENMNQVSFCFV